ncbi:MAG: hypothetical protein L3J06_10630 [Cyclobacteriaceae bacterium]|nr:hypothetical protein [Cyclobacteriaceae bacterium]
MAIPKVIYQTYSSPKEIPLMARFHRWSMCRMNPTYEYQFFDDDAIDAFIKSEFGLGVYKQYSKIAIGAAKADFFRYAILLKKGGIYLDIDSKINGKLDSWVSKSDKAIITEEGNPGFYVQWALIYDKGHPFLAKTIENILDNIRTNRYPNDVHKMTGPTVYSNAIKQCIKEDTTIPYRLLGIDYEGKITFKYWLSGFSFNKKEHWRVSEKKRGVLKLD